MSNNLNLALRLSADATRLMAGLARGEGGVRKFGRAVKGELDALGRFAGSVEGRLAQLGLGVSAVALGVQSANLDKELTQLKLTAGGTADEVGRLRDTLFAAQSATGQGVDELKGGVDALIAGGLSMAEAIATVDPMAETLAVAKTNADALAKAMGVASKQFDIDLSNTEEARLLLDKMVVAGRAGNAELEDLPNIFARIGNSAKSSNLGIDQTLALVEALSLVEPSAERLATLTDSTLRVFTNARYMQAAGKATGVKFFDADGSRRDALDVIGDIKSRYDKLETDVDRFRFINRAFGKTDLDTQRGLKTLLDGDSLGRLDEIFSEISGAGGTIARDLPEAISNAVDQTGRLKGVLREAADGFAKPINDALSNTIKWGLDSKENGGLGLDGTDIIAGGVVGALGLFGAARYGGKAIKGLAGKFGGVAAGVATGKALEEAAGVQPVYVVNMPGDFGGLGGIDKVASAAGELLNPKTFGKIRTTIGLLGASNLSALPMYGAGAMATAGAAVAGAGAAGYGVGTLISDYLLTSEGPLGSDMGARIGDAIGEAVAYAISPFSAEARAAIEANKRASEVTGSIAIKIDSEGRARVTQLQSTGVDLVTSATYTGGQGF